MDILIIPNCIGNLHSPTYNTISGYYDDDEQHRFGTINRKGLNRPLSNFSFKFLKKIVAVDPASTGYVVEVTPEYVGHEDSGSESELDTCNPTSR